MTYTNPQTRLTRRICVTLAFVLTCAAAASSGELTLGWWTIDAGGDVVADGSGDSLSGTIGQPDAGVLSGGTYTLVGGFWGDSGATPGYYIGDLNCDGAVDLFDIDPFVIALTSASQTPPFADYGAAFPDCNPLLADINSDGTVDLFDIDPFVVLLTGP